MHEYSLAQALIEQVEREARARDASAIRHVTVRIGPLAGLETELLRTAYGQLRTGTLESWAVHRPAKGGVRCDGVCPALP